MNNIERAKKVKILITDVDGVLTDGSLNFFRKPDDDKMVEIKSFYSLDGIGLLSLRMCGIKTAIITGGVLGSTGIFMQSLGMNYIYHQCFAKQPPLEHLSKISNIPLEEMAFIGDDLIDLPVIKRVGFACVVPNGVQEVKDIAHYQTEKAGGKGAVREVAEYILKAQGKWDQFLDIIDKGLIAEKQKSTSEVYSYADVLEEK